MGGRICFSTRGLRIMEGQHSHGDSANLCEECTDISKMIPIRQNIEGASATIVFRKRKITAVVPGHYGRNTEPLTGITPQRFPFTLPLI
jgi:hypothetical protein